MRNNKSFTLIELLVVIVIIGILAGVIMISTSSSIDKANFAKAQAFSSTVQNELLSNLVSEWTFDNASNIGEDTWENNHGTLYGPAGSQNLPQLQPVSECVFGTCLKFDGEDDYIDCGNNSSLSMGLGDQTIAMWVKFASISASGNKTLIMNGGGDLNPGSPGIWMYKMSTISDVRFNFSDGTAGRVSKTIAYINDTKWHHLIVIIDRDKGVTAYVDGMSFGITSDITGQKSSVKNIFSTRIGGYSATQHPFNGSIDDVRIYNTVLSSSQIKQNYIAGLDSLLSKDLILKEEYNQRIKGLSSK